jgi:hypothetical protein
MMELAPKKKIEQNQFLELYLLRLFIGIPFWDPEFLAGFESLFRIPSLGQIHILKEAK